MAMQVSAPRVLGLFPSVLVFTPTCMARVPRFGCTKRRARASAHLGGSERAPREAKGVRARPCAALPPFVCVHACPCTPSHHVGFSGITWARPLQIRPNLDRRAALDMAPAAVASGARRAAAGWGWARAEAVPPRWKNPCYCDSQARRPRRSHGARPHRHVPKRREFGPGKRECGWHVSAHSKIHKKVHEWGCTWLNNTQAHKVGGVGARCMP